MTEKPSSEEAWRQVGRQFEALGESLARTIRAAWERAESREDVQAMQSGLESMVNRVDRAIKETASSPEATETRQELTKAAESLHQAGSQTWQEMQPHLISALDQVNNELQKLINRLQSKTGE